MTTDTRPRLRPDCWYVPLDGGLHLRTATSNLELTGTGLHPLLDRLAPHLDGTNSLDTLVAGLPPQPARVVRDLVETLLERGFAYDAAAEQGHGLAPWELRQYAQEIALAETTGGSAAYRFERFRLGQVLLVGSGGSLAALVRTMLRLGLRHPWVWTTPEAPTDHAGLEAGLAECREGDPTLDLTVIDGGDPGRERLAARLAGFDAILHCSDRPMLGRALALAGAASAAGIPALHALPVAGTAWVGPATGGTTGGCFECAMRRLQDAAGNPALAVADQPETAPEPYLSGPLVATVSALLAARYFQLAVAAAPPAAGGMTAVDLEQVSTSEHVLHRHPRCGACRPAPPPPVAVRVAGLADRPATTAEDLSRQGVQLVDPRLGPLTELSEQGLAQLPLHAVAATVAGSGGAAGRQPDPVLAVAPDRARARRRALVRGVELAASRLAVERPDHTMWWDPVAGATVESAVEPEEMTVAAGFSWVEAVGRALLRRHGHRRLFAAGPSERGWRSPEPVDYDDETRDLLAAAGALDAQVEVSLRTGRVAEASVRDGSGNELARACALTAPVALRTAVETAVAAVAGHPVAGDEIPPDLGEEAWSDRWDPLLRQVVAAGSQVLVAPVDSDPGIAATVPFLAAVAVRPTGGAR